jgi:hypothetical protein
LHIDTPVITQVQKLRNTIEDIDKNADDNDNKEIVPKEFRTKIDAALDTYDIAVSEDTEEMRGLKNYLARVNGEIKNDMYDFISKNSGATKKTLRDIKTLLNTFMKWGDCSEDARKTSISDESTYNNIQFVKNYIHQFLSIFPETIINNVDYQNAVSLPNYWNLSKNHVSDLKNIISEYYVALRPFYNDKVVLNIVKKIPEITKNLLTLTLDTPYMTEIKYKEEKTYSVFDKRTSELLFENYFLQTLNIYKKLAEDSKMLVLVAPEEQDERELALTIENMEPQNNIVIFVLIIGIF